MCVIPIVTIDGAATSPFPEKSQIKTRSYLSALLMAQSHLTPPVLPQLHLATSSQPQDRTIDGSNTMHLRCHHKPDAEEEQEAERENEVMVEGGDTLASVLKVRTIDESLQSIERRRHRMRRIRKKLELKLNRTVESEGSSDPNVKSSDSRVSFGLVHWRQHETIIGVSGGGLSTVPKRILGWNYNDLDSESLPLYESPMNLVKMTFPCISSRGISKAKLVLLHMGAIESARLRPRSKVLSKKKNHWYCEGRK